MSQILVVGSNMYDLTSYTKHLPQAGETLEGIEFKMGFGGKGANQAMAAAKSGGNVAILTAVGDDEFGRNILKNFKDNNINDSFAHVVKGQANGIATVIVDETAQNRIIIIKGANAYLTKQNVDDVLSQLPDVKILVLQLEISLDIVYYAIEKAKKLNIPILLNPAPAIDHLDMDIVTMVDFIVPNETELEILSGLPVRTMDEIEIAAKSLLDKGIQYVIVTLGKKGAYFISYKTSFHICAPKVNAVDTTGAGDAFIGAFVKEYTEHNNIQKAIETAVEYASLSTTKAGAQSSYITKI